MHFIAIVNVIDIRIITGVPFHTPLEVDKCVMNTPLRRVEFSLAFIQTMHLFAENVTALLPRVLERLMLSRTTQARKSRAFPSQGVF